LAEFTPRIGVNPAELKKNIFFANVVPVTKNVDPAVCCPYQALLIYDFVSF